MKSEDTRILELALKAMSHQLDELVGACMDGETPKAPPRNVLARARAALPPYCKWAYRKTEKAPQT